MPKFNVGDRIKSVYDGDSLEGTVVMNDKAETGFILIQRDDGFGWDGYESDDVKRLYPHLCDLSSLWWESEEELMLGLPKQSSDGYDIDA